MQRKYFRCPSMTQSIYGRFATDHTNQSNVYFVYLPTRVIEFYIINRLIMRSRARCGASLIQKLFVMQNSKPGISK